MSSGFDFEGLEKSFNRNKECTFATGIRAFVAMIECTHAKTEWISILKDEVKLIPLSSEWNTYQIQRLFDRIAVIGDEDAPVAYIKDGEVLLQSQHFGPTLELSGTPGAGKDWTLSIRNYDDDYEVTQCMPFFDAAF